MSGTPPSRLGWRIAAALLPLLTGLLGLYNNINDWRQAETFGQHLVGLGVIIYGPLGIAAAVAILLRHRRARLLLLSFSVIACIVAGLAPVVWGGAPVFSAIFSLFGAGVLCAGALWAESMTRAPATAPTS